MASLVIEGIEISGEGTLVDFSLGNDTSSIVSDKRLVPPNPPKPPKTVMLLFRIDSLRDSLGYLQNVMRCIDAALAGDFSALNATKSVSAAEFMLMLNKIMLGLSDDTTNIDFIIYFDFILLEIEGEISQYHIQSLLRSVRQRQMLMYN